MLLPGMSALRAALFALGLVAASSLAGIASASAQQFDVPASARSAIVDQTNAYRQAKGLGPLTLSEDASSVAQAYANYLARTAKGGHRADGRDPVQRLRAGGVKFCKFRGENWHESWTRPARASPDAAMNAAMRFWKRSPGHERALRSRSTEIGVGVAGWKHGNQWYYQEIQVFIDTSCLKRSQAVDQFHLSPIETQQGRRVAKARGDRAVPTTLQLEHGAPMR
jgi:uncharacterized protein YkwD